MENRCERWLNFKYLTHRVIRTEKLGFRTEEAVDWLRSKVDKKEHSTNETKTLLS